MGSGAPRLDLELDAEAGADEALGGLRYPGAIRAGPAARQGLQDGDPAVQRAVVEHGHGDPSVPQSGTGGKCLSSADGGSRRVARFGTAAWRCIRALRYYTEVGVTIPEASM